MSRGRPFPGILVAEGAPRRSRRPSIMRSSSVLTFLPFVLSCFGLAASATAQHAEAMTYRVRSLVPLMVPAQQLAAAIHSALPDYSGRDEERRLDAGDDGPSPQWVVELLKGRHASAVDSERLVLDTSLTTRPETVGIGGSLLVRGQLAAVEACLRDFDAIVAAVGRPLEVTAYRLPLPEGPLPAATWDAAALQQALQRARPLWLAHGRTRSGGPLRLAQESGRGYLRDVDVEVASRARITDPKPDVVFAGARATLTAHALAGDEVLLSGSWLLSEPVALHQQAMGTDGQRLDLPEQRTACVSFAGRVSSGGALVVAGRGGDVGPSGFLLVVGARYLAPPAGDLPADLLVRPVGALLTQRGTVRPQLGWRLPGDDRDGFPLVARDGGLDETDLSKLLSSAMAGQGSLDDGVLTVSGDVDACRRTDVALTQLMAQLRPAALHSRVEGQGLAVLECVQPVLGDRAAFAFLGRERALLCDQEVEIAEKAQIPNPIVDVARAGLWHFATAVAGPSTWHLAGAWTVAAHEAPHLREHADKPPMNLQLVDYRTTMLPWDAPMAVGQEHVLGDGPAWTANGPATRVVVRLIAP